MNIFSRGRDNEPRAAKAAVINHREAQPVRGGNSVSQLRADGFWGLFIPEDARVSWKCSCPCGDCNKSSD